MKELLVHLRAMQLYAHNAHNLVARVPFHQDHEYFGDVYGSLEGDYDDVIERIIGLYGEEGLDLGSILQSVALKLQGCPSVGVKENSVFYIKQLQLEQELCSLVSKVIVAGCSPGVEQLIGDICNKSESRQYKIKQRIKK